MLNCLAVALKTQKSKSAFEINLPQTRSLEHIFCFLTKLLFLYCFTLRTDLRRKPFFGHGGKEVY